MRLPSILPPNVVIGMAAVALSGAFLAGWKVESWRWSVHEAKVLSEALAQYEKQLAQQVSEATKYEQGHAAGQVASRARETSIRTIYKDVAVPADCAVPDAARSVLAQAVADANAAATGGPGTAVSGTP